MGPRFPWRRPCPPQPPPGLRRALAPRDLLWCAALSCLPPPHLEREGIWTVLRAGVGLDRDRVDARDWSTRREVRDVFGEWLGTRRGRAEAFAAEQRISCALVRNGRVARRRERIRARLRFERDSLGPTCAG